MTSPCPQKHHSKSYSQRENRSYDDLSRQYLPVQDHNSRKFHQRSPSQARQPYTSNCGRRRWPPSPKVEEVKYEEEIPMRGKIGQNPMIIDVPTSISSDSGSESSKDSDDSSGSETPPTDSDNRDRRYVWKPEPDIPIPQAYDTRKDSKPTGQKSAIDPQDRERGRKKVPKLDTGLARGTSTGGPPPPLERARSPYASGPQDRIPKPAHFSGEHMLSPDMMSPRKAYTESPHSRSQYIPRPGGAPPESVRSSQRMELPAHPSIETHRSHSHYIPRPMEVHNIARDGQGTQSSRVSARPSLGRRSLGLPYPDDPSDSGGRQTINSDSSRQTKRLAMGRRGSELPYPSSPPSASGNRPRSRHPQGSLDDSDSDSSRPRSQSNQASPQTLSKHPTSASSKARRNYEKKLSSEIPAPLRHHERKFSAELPPSPLRRSVPSSDAHDRPVNLSSLVSGAAITQTLNAMLTGDHTAARRASPRPSPRGSPTGSPSASPRCSPKTSPFSSPPRTPTSEPPQLRANPITGLKKDSPNSRPPSPLSSRSSIWTAESEQFPCEGTHSEKSRQGPVSRKTAPLPTPHVERPKGSDLLSSPEMVVRPPSPAKHTKSFSAESNDPRHPEVDLRDEPSARQSLSSNFRPTGLIGRQRSASSADIRPHLVVNTTSSKGPESTLSPNSKSRPASPSPVTPGQRYKPSNLQPVNTTAQSRSSRPEVATSGSTARSRSRPYVPEPTLEAQKAHSAAVIPTASAPCSRSAMPIPAFMSTRSWSSAPKPEVQDFVPIPPAKLPKCPRPHSVAGHDDWYTLHENRAFAICPTCRDSVFGTKVSLYLQPRPETSSRKTLCDLNNPWIRLALSLRGPDVKLLSALSDVTSKERSCPGDELAPRDWYRLEDAETGKHISGFNACPHCVHSLETLLPAWRNVFYRPRSHETKERFCGLRANANRFGDFLNMIIESSLEADQKRKTPNTASVCELAKQLAAVDDCPKDRMFARKAWHIHPHLPEFTICQECYETFVYPLVQSGNSLAAKIDKKPHQFPNPETEVCCHLYSPRMQRVFREACEDDDYEHLRHTVLKRHMLQQDILGTFKELNDHPGDREVDDRLRELLERWKDRE